MRGDGGDDQAYGGTGADTLQGGAGNDLLAGGEGNDALQGGDGDDTLQGDDGDDALAGGAGADTLVGGAGADSLSGAAGDDTITTGTGADVVYMYEGDGSDLITDFDMTRVSGRTVDQLDVSDLLNAEGNPVSWRDVVVSDTNNDGTGDAVLTFPGGESLILGGVSPRDVSGKQEMAAMGIPCFASGTLIDTPDGPCAVEALTAGALVVTREGVAVPVLWAGGRNISQGELALRPSAVPVRVAAGVLGNAGDLMLSQQHAVLMCSAGQGEVLVQIGHLAAAGHPGVRLARGVRRVSYHHLLMPQHSVLNAMGAPVESLYPGRQALLALTPMAQMAVAQAIFTRPAAQPLAGFALDDCAQAYGPRYRPLLTRMQVIGQCAQGLLTPASCTAGQHSTAA